METRVKFGKTFYVICGVLVVICLVQAGIIWKYVIDKSPNDGVYKNADSFSSFLDHTFQKENNLKWNMFDRFFDDDFFLKQDDPFKEMDRIQKQIENMMQKNHRIMLNGSWKGWFDDRFLGKSSDISIKTEEKGDKYVVIVTIPNLKQDKLDIDVAQDGIAISGELSQLLEKKDHKGNVISKSEMHQSISKKIPIPDDADYEKAQVDYKNDEIFITLPKKT